MKINYKFVMMFILGILLLAMAGFSLSSKTGFDSTGLIKLYDCQTMRDFFLESLVSANKPGGLIVLKNSCSENFDYAQYSSENLTLNQRLNLIVQTNEGYSWKDEDGVIFLAPNTANVELLEVKISKANVSFDTNISPVLSDLLQLPEVKEKLKKLNLRMGLQYGGLQSPPSKNPPTEMLFENKSLRQILNEIVKKRGRGVWVYSEHKSGGINTFSLNFQVQ